MNSRNLRKALLALLMAASTALAGPPTVHAGGPPVAGDRVDPAIADGSAARELNRARARWKGSSVRRYRFRVKRVCYCVPPANAVVRVHGRRAVRVSPRGWLGPRNVPQLYRVIGEAIKSKAAKLEVAYHPKSGYPRRIYIDYLALGADDEIGYSVRWLRRLGPKRSGR